jgi:hypothetical protein
VIIFLLAVNLVKFENSIKELDEKLVECDKKFMNYSKENGRKFKHNKQEFQLRKIAKIDQNCKKSEIPIFIHSSSTGSNEYFDKRQALRKIWVSEAVKFNITVFSVIAEPKDDKTRKRVKIRSI